MSYWLHTLWTVHRIYVALAQLRYWKDPQIAKMRPRWLNAPQRVWSLSLKKHTHIPFTCVPDLGIYSDSLPLPDENTKGNYTKSPSLMTCDSDSVGSLEMGRPLPQSIDQKTNTPLPTAASHYTIPMNKTAHEAARPVTSSRSQSRPSQDSLVISDVSICRR
jgi:hypothetical protein